MRKLCLFIATMILVATLSASAQTTTVTGNNNNVYNGCCHYPHKGGGTGVSTKKFNSLKKIVTQNSDDIEDVNNRLVLVEAKQDVVIAENTALKARLALDESIIADNTRRIYRLEDRVDRLDSMNWVFQNALISIQNHPAQQDTRLTDEQYKTFRSVRRANTWNTIINGVCCLVNIVTGTVFRVGIAPRAAPNVIWDNEGHTRQYVAQQQPQQQYYHQTTNGGGTGQGRPQIGTYNDGGNIFSNGGGH